MANKNRQLSDTLENFEEFAHQYNFYSALRLLENQNKDKTRLGENRSPKSDQIFFGQNVSLTFSASAIDKVRRNEKKLSEKWLDINFFGLLGPNGPLPKHLTELFISDMVGNKQPTFIDFLNLFNHRLITLFYRAWANTEPTTQNDSPENNKFKLYLGALAGYAQTELHNRDQMPDYAKFRYPRFLGGKTRYKEGVERMITDMFGIQTRVQNFVGEWLKIPEDALCKIESGPYGKRLGIDSTQGRYSWQCQYKFRVSLGPMDLDEFNKLLPGEKLATQINDTIRNYVGMEYQWDIVLLLKQQEVPQLKLQHGKYRQLGWTSWLKGDFKRDVNSVSDIHLNSEQFTQSALGD